MKNPIHKAIVQKNSRQPRLFPSPMPRSQTARGNIFTAGGSRCVSWFGDELGVGSGVPTPEYLLYIYIVNKVTNLLYKGAHHGMEKNWKRAQSANAKIFTI
jgi:hypothetical protein